MAAKNCKKVRWMPATLRMNLLSRMTAVSYTHLAEDFCVFAAYPEALRLLLHLLRQREAVDPVLKAGIVVIAPPLLFTKTLNNCG